MKWLIAAGNEKDKTKRFHEKLGEEIVAAYHHRVCLLFCSSLLNTSDLLSSLLTGWVII